jgi:D-tyrosyl-tRNA(Tyr) deacylase
MAQIELKNQHEGQPFNIGVTFPTSALSLRALSPHYANRQVFLCMSEAIHHGLGMALRDMSKNPPNNIHS